MQKLTREIAESNGWDLRDTDSGVSLHARFWVEDYGPFDTEGEALEALAVIAPNILEDAA